MRTRLDERVTHDVLTRAMAELRPTRGQSLRVLDVASGTGSGYALLTGSRGESAPATAGCQVSYLGLDADPTAVAVARSAHPEADFEIADIREDVPDGRFDLYLSCSAAYSWLKPEEVHEVLGALFAKVARERQRAVFVVDTLGRYSVEWASHWSETRWNYTMSLDEQDAAGERSDDVERSRWRGAEELMTFFDRRSLGAIIEGAADAAGIPAVVSFDDRDVLLGRHTDTGAFNPDIPRYRALLNELVRGSPPVRLGELLFEPPAVEAPAWISGFFEEWAQDWNQIVRDFGAPEGESGGEPDGGLDLDAVVDGERAQRLASTLLEHERNQQRGLGAGHFLTATAVLDAT